jgi:general secretion pathway protein L
MAASLDLPRSPEPDWRRRARSFWRWWTGELSAFARERFGAIVQAARAPLVSLEGESLVLLERRDDRLEETARLQMEGLDAEGRRKALGELLARAGEDGRRVRFVLGRGESLLRRIALPLATEENLNQVLAFEMDRLTPFSADDVYFGCRIASRDTAAEKLHVDLGIARRDLVDARIAALASVGALVQSVALAEDAARSDKPIDVMPEATGEREGASDARLVRRVLVGAVLALAAVALALPVWQKRETVIALLPMVDKARIEAEATGKLAAELEKLTADYNFLLTRKHANPPALAYVEEMSRLLPDQTWVSQLDLRSTGKMRELQIQGETTSSSKLIELLEQSTLVQNAAPRGTVTRGMMPGTERFLIAAEAKSVPLPERQDVASMPVPVAPARPAPAPAPASPAAAAGTPGGAPPAPADPKAAPKPAQVTPIDPKGAPAKGPAPAPAPTTSGTPPPGAPKASTTTPPAPPKGAPAKG